MSNIIPFDFKTKQIRVIEIDGEPWFVAFDIATLLGYAKPRNAIAQHCKAATTAPKQGGGFISIIPERDVYRLVMRSKLPEAEAFEEWLVGEVLPSIRKTGSYGQQKQEVITDESIFKLALDTLQPDPASKITMLKRFGESRGKDMQFLPDYSKSQGVHHSISELLKTNKVDLSARKANQILLDLGMIEIKTRKSTTSNKVKEFKCVTEKGLKYGCNLVNPNNPMEMTPHWFDYKFPALLGEINQWMSEREMAVNENLAP